jgi:hypothetical protein
MIATKNYIIESLENLSKEQLEEVADFTAFIKTRYRIQNNKKNKNYAELYREFSSDDKIIADSGMGDYNSGLLQEEKSITALLPT